jgi:Flp pilus assembly protein CpaB
LKPGTVLQSSDVKTIPWAAAELPKGNFGNVDDVVGSSVFDTIGEGEPVIESRLASAKSAGGAGVPSGMRAVSVHVSDSTGVLGLLRAGQMVDVQVVRGKGQTDIAVRTALENLRVLSVIPQAELSSQGTSLPVVTLLATPPEADILAAADAGARVRLTLRNPLDLQTRSRSPLTLDGVMKPSGPELTTSVPKTGSTGTASAQVGNAAVDGSTVGSPAAGSARHP